MNIEALRLVRFDKFCPICEYWENKETDYPCWVCLEDGANEESEKPKNFKLAEKIRKEQEKKK